LAYQFPESPSVAGARDVVKEHKRIANRRDHLAQAKQFPVAIYMSAPRDPVQTIIRDASRHRLVYEWINDMHEVAADAD
jgi:hypothetical protein